MTSTSDGKAVSSFRMAETPSTDTTPGAYNRVHHSGPVATYDEATAELAKPIARRGLLAKLKSFSTHDIYDTISPIFRRRRMAKFLRQFNLDKNTRILDVGGYPEFWAETNFEAPITTLNLHPVEVPPALQHRITATTGDGTRLPFNDGEFDIVFSNSVIEHLGSYEAQQHFAKEIRRVGKAYWVQTPAMEFPVEPHFLAPFIHWLPRGAQRRMARHFTGWGLITKPSKQTIENFLDEIRLLKYRQMKELFPDGQIMVEKLLLTRKSYTAYRSA